MLDPWDTIVAVSSHPGPAARGIVRLSGPEALTIALDGFEGDDAGSIPTKPTVYTGRIRLMSSPSPLAREGRVGGSTGWPEPSAPHPTLPREGGGFQNHAAAGEDRTALAVTQVMLPVALVLWPGPRSYTGQPVAEIHAVGSPPLLEHLVARCLARGARLAERGEFTLRAFLAGRIDLAQSEAVLGVIEARSPAQLDVALRQLAGSLAGPVRELRDRLLDRLVDLEANLDFVDEGDIPPVARRALIDDLAESARVLTALIDRHRARNRSDGRPRVVLAGAPNAGKSRLFNALLGEDRAIVAPVAGTTRDDVSGHVELDGLAIELVDTAGEELASSAIAAAAQSRRAGRVADADLVVRCVPADGLDRASAGPPDARTILIATKADLATEPGPPGAIATSALTGSGLASLRSAIAGRIRSLASEGGIDREIGPESYEALERAARSVAAAEALAADRATEELIAVELRQAIDDLGTLVGAVVSEDILDRIFRRFCVGK